MYKNGSVNTTGVHRQPWQSTLSSVHRKHLQEDDPGSNMVVGKTRHYRHEVLGSSDKTGMTLQSFLENQGGPPAPCYSFRHGVYSLERWTDPTAHRLHFGVKPSL